MEVFGEVEKIELYNSQNGSLAYIKYYQIDDCFKVFYYFIQAYE